MTPIFISLDEALLAHARMIELFGGSAGLRDIGLLQSALATSGQAFGGTYLHSFPHEMAAAYLFHVVKNHPFIDGNKRAGATLARIFLLMNDCTFDPDEIEYGDLTLGVAAGEIDKPAVVAFFKQHVSPA